MEGIKIVGAVTDLTNLAVKLQDIWREKCSLTSYFTVDFEDLLSAIVVF